MIHLYPPSFRRHYGADLAQHFDDLVADRGRPAAWARTLVDLVVTVPRSRLESVMNQQPSATAVSVAIGACAAMGVVSFLVGIYPGLVLLGVAVALAAGERGQLAKALRVPDTHRRRRRFVTALVLAGVFIVTYIAFLSLIGDTWTVRETVLAAIGTPAMIGAPLFLIAALLTPKSTDETPGVPSSEGA